MASPMFLTFNVAGNRFTTSRDTLLKEPASRLALLVRGVLPTVKDDQGSIFLDRDAKYFQLVLNYLRDGWCSLPSSPQERRELLQEVRWYQLASMEAWIKSQELATENAALLRSPSPVNSPLEPYTIPTAYSRSSIMSPPLPAAAASPITPPTEAAFHCAFSASAANSLNPSPIRSSFLSGPNQDLLAAGALANAGISSINTITSNRYSTAAVQLPAKLSVTGGAGMGLNGIDTAGQGAMYNGGYAALGVQASATEPAAATGLTRNSSLQLHATDSFKWTTRLLQNNPKMQEVVNTLLELAYLPPHPSLHVGKTTISFSSECQHQTAGRASSMMLLAVQQQVDGARFSNKVIHVSNTMGWAFELALRPSSDATLHDKYNIAEYLQDNWFVLTAVMKEQFGVIMEEDSSNKPSCLACRRQHITINLQKFY